MFEYHTLNKMLLQGEVFDDGHVVTGCPHQSGGKHHGQVVRSHLVTRAVVDNSLQVLAKVLEELVVCLGEELEGVGEHLPVSLWGINVLNESCRERVHTGG